jgi:ribulose-5-phosphate 4-epimerase/fuculose-1-phosphate aldolase
MHLAAYRARPAAGGVVHLHSIYATALSCLADVDREDALTPVTPYPSMLFGSVAVVPYFPPGSEELSVAAGEAMRAHSAILLANHGPIVAAATFRAAVFAAEELEEAARLSLILRAHEPRILDAAALAHLRRG